MTAAPPPDLLSPRVIHPVPVAMARTIPAPAATPATSRGHFYWIDWLRFLAAAAVMVEHIRAHNRMDWQYLPESARTAWRFALLVPTRFGRESVILFFVISGFLVGGKTIRRVRDGTFGLRAYALDRVTRIYVPLLPALALTMAVSVACGLPVRLEQYLYHLIGMQDVCVLPLQLDTPLWTLSCETWFYVLGGAAAVLAVPGTRGKMVAFVFAVVSLLLFLQLEFAYLFCWLLGAFAYGLIDAVRPRRALLGAVSVVVAVAACACYQVANDVVPVNPVWKDAVPPVRACEIVLAAALSILIACLAGTPPGSVVGRRIEQAGSRLAAFSYTLYLVHYPVMCYLLVRWRGLGGGIAGRFCVRLAICTAVSAVMYALFEAHTARVRRWWQGRLSVS